MYMKLVLAVMTVCFVCDLRAETVVKTFNSRGVKAIKVKNSSGSVRVVSSATQKTEVQISKKDFGPDCAYEIREDGSQLMVRVYTDAMILTDSCVADITIKAPQTVNLELAQGSGSADISGITGTLTFSSGSGNISADGIFQKVSGLTGSGNVTLKGLSGGGSVKVGSGDMNITYLRKPLKGELDLVSGSGDAQVRFPKGTKVRTNFSAGSGTMTNELGESESAEFGVSMKAGSGDLKVGTY